MIVFLLSSIGKLRDMAEFKFTIQRFKLLPNWLVAPVPWLFVGSELIVVIFILVGGIWIWLGFTLAILLLSAFSVALMSVLARNIQTSCNCFGSSQNLVSPYDVGRNVVFILCALAGLWTYTNANNSFVNPNFLEVGLTGLTALVFVLFAINLNEIVQVLK